ncbi:hypothetical protein ACJQUH_003678, partial [Shigella flexneri]
RELNKIIYTECKIVRSWNNYIAANCTFVLASAFFLQDCWQGKQLAPSNPPHRYRTLFSGHFYLPSEMVPYATHRRNHENNNLL